MSASNETPSTLRNEAGQTYDQATSAGSRILDSAGRPMQRARGRGEQLSAQIGSAIRRQPVAAFAVGVGLGLVIGRLSA